LLTGNGDDTQEEEEMVKTADELAKQAAQKLAAEAADDGSRCAHRR
jgi:hypothetical protein